ADKEKHAALLRESQSSSEEEARLATTASAKMYAVVPGKPGASRLLARGDVTMPGETVSAEVPGTLERWLGKTRLKPDAAEGERRKALAAWIADRRNPLFARVMANRLWHHHFGTGLVDTPSDFGFNGGKPSHPELLDWLAAELMEDWSLKRLHRLIVTSRAYRQSSAIRKEAMARDADNRLVWRKTPARLEAEGIRDAMLAVSGALDRRMGGKPYLDFKTFFFKGTQFYEPLDQEGPAFRRRSLYRMWARGGRSPFLDTFDCPDPSAATPKRQATTTPLQALALLNNAQVFDLAAEMAGRAGTDVGQAWRLAYQRDPTEKERALAEPFAKRNGMAALCRVLFNSGEFSLGE
ncbi:MAG: DUF1553 domain-containing protein, partial [Gemmataceae bacterium]|nr:DUF1553 domain-containing protein [Gemmataceae bacterium]